MAGAGTEIERRFKLRDPQQAIVDRGDLVSQWYLPSTGSWTARCRIITSRGGISTYSQTMKRGFDELESSLTQQEFCIMKDRCTRVGVHKLRYGRVSGGYLWELDVYRNIELVGLKIAEVELPSLTSLLLIPSWVGVEITGVRCLSNVALSRFLNATEDRHQAEQIVAMHFGLDYKKTAGKLGEIPVVSLFNPISAQIKTNSTIADLLVKYNAHDVLNDKEIGWLYTDKDITLLDLALMIYFVRRKLAKKKQIKSR